MIRKIAASAMIAAMYAALTIMLAPISFGSLQFRVAEAMTVLPFIMPESIPGLFVGCLIANFAGGMGLIDVFFGSAATFLAAAVSYKSPNIWIAAASPVLFNALIVGGYLSFITDTPLLLSMLYIGASEAVICFALGVPLCRLLAHSKVFDTFPVIKKETSRNHWERK